MTGCEFHWREGWKFRRIEGGAVTITNGEARLSIPATEWISIISSLSPSGSTADSRVDARWLHMSRQDAVNGE